MFKNVFMCAILAAALPVSVSIADEVNQNPAPQVQHSGASSVGGGASVFSNAYGDAGGGIGFSAAIMENYRDKSAGTYLQVGGQGTLGVILPALSGHVDAEIGKTFQIAQSNCHLVTGAGIVAGGYAGFGNMGKSNPIRVGNKRSSATTLYGGSMIPQLKGGFLCDIANSSVSVLVTANAAMPIKSDGSDDYNSYGVGPGLSVGGGATVFGKGFFAKGAILRPIVNNGELKTGDFLFSTGVAKDDIMFGVNVGVTDYMGSMKNDLGLSGTGITAGIGVGGVINAF